MRIEEGCCLPVASFDLKCTINYRVTGCCLYAHSHGATGETAYIKQDIDTSGFSRPEKEIIKWKITITLDMHRRLYEEKDFLMVEIGDRCRRQRWKISLEFANV